MPQFQINKWVRVALSLAIVVLAWGTSFDWTTLVSAKTAGTIVGAIAFAKTVIAFFAPSAGTPVATTDSAIITHTAQS